MFRVFFLVAFVTLLSGCGNAGEKAGPRVPEFPAPAPEDQTLFLEEFPLLDAQGNEAAPVHSDFAGHPVGALLGLPGKGQSITFCSASHLESGYVLTNAHCVPNWQQMGPKRYFVVFYDNRGVKSFSALESFIYVGNTGADDVALLKIPAEAAAHWAQAGRAAKSVATAQATQADPNPKPLSLAVHLWAFDPFTPSHPQLAQKYQNMPGMIFQPRDCQVSRTKPTLVGVKVTESGALDRTQIRNTQANPILHFFIDSCNRAPVHGNSGSLVTTAGKFDEKIGVFHWMSGTRETQTFDYIEYTGNDGQTRFIHDAKPGTEFFGIGYLFDHFRIAHPHTFF